MLGYRSKIGKELIKELFQEFKEEMDLRFSTDKNLELFDFILEEHLSSKQLKQIKKFKSMRNLFYDMFTLATQSDTSFNTSRLIFDVFSAKMRQLFDESAEKKLILELSESLPRFFKNLVMGKHSKYVGIPIQTLIERFKEIFGNILVTPKPEEIAEAIQEHVYKKYPSRFINMSDLQERIKNSQNKPIILDTSVVLYGLQNEKESFYNLLNGKSPMHCFIIPTNIFVEIALHYEFFDGDFTKLLRHLWICNIEKELILKMYKEVSRIDEFEAICKNHNHVALLNDLSLVILGRHLQNYQGHVISRDLNLLKILNYFQIPCNTNLASVIKFS